MKKFTVFLAMFILSGWGLMGCQRNQGVYAGNESDTYQPRPAPKTDEMKGELVEVSLTGRTIEIRLENGLAQTFRFDENTEVSGLDIDTKPNDVKTAKVSPQTRALVGKEGSEVNVVWSDQNDSKVAKSIEVTQIHSNKPARRSRH